MKKKKHIWIIFTIIASFAIAITCFTNKPEANIFSESTMLQLAVAPELTDIDSLFENSTFFVEARMIYEEDFLEGTSYRYKFHSIADYANNLKTDEDGDFYVYSMSPGQFESDQTYYLFMNAFEAYMADTIMYQIVDSQYTLERQQTLFKDNVNILNNTETLTISNSTFENELNSYVKSNSASIESKTANTFTSDSIDSLDAAVEYADAIWKITINSINEINPLASICEYKIDSVFRGNTDTAPEGSVFNGVFPTEKVETNCQYYVLLTDVGNYEYEPFSFEYWIYPTESANCDELVSIISVED